MKHPCASSPDSILYSGNARTMKTTCRLARSFLALALCLPMGACVTQRTVTRNGQPVEQGLVVKRPLKEAVENSR